MESSEELPTDGDTQPLEGAEEGELEEGELDDEDDGGGDQQVAAPVDVAPADNVPDTPPAEKPEVDAGGPSSNTESEAEDEEKKEKKRKKREKRKHKHKERKEGKKKKKRSKYVDYDNIQDEGVPPGGDKESSMWSHGGYNQRPVPDAYDSPPGPYDSPDEELSMPPQKGYRKNSYDDRVPDAYDDMYGSPPGPYDSPSDGEDEYGPPPSKMKRYDQQKGGNNKRSMMNMLDDGYMDANVAANEKQDMFDKSVKGPPNKRKMEQKNRFFDRMRERQKQQDRQQEGRERERPICKFYKDGKCQKGEDCQYSHDFEVRNSKKPDLCKFYLNSYCSKGASCQYYHGEYPCKFFHTGKECFQGDNCKFSHAELTDETRPLLERIISQDQEKEEVRYENSPRKKPSLLGSPPRNNNPNMKKIPSLFDIKVFPPGQRPPNMDNGPGMGGPGGMGNQGPPNGPMGQGGPGMGGPGGPGQFGPRGPGVPSPMRNPMGPGLLGMSPMGMGPGPMGGMPGGMPPQSGMSPQQGMPNMRPTFYGSAHYGDEEKPQDQGGSQDDSEDKENEKSAGSPKDGSDGEGKKEQTFDIPAALAPEQRKLFLRIQQQQRDEGQAQQGGGKDQQKSDENWYSSDEEEGNQSQGPANSGNQIVDMLKAIRSQPPPSQPNLPPMHMPPPPLLPRPPPPMMMNRPPPPFGVSMAPPSLDLMLNMLRSATSSANTSAGVQVTRSTQRDPRASTKTDPRSGAASDPRSAAASKTVDPRVAQDTPTSSLDPRVLLPALRPPSEPTVIYSKPGSVEYKLRVVTVEHKPIKELPPNITPMDPRLPSLQQQVIKASKGASQSKRDDPRSQSKTDPRLQRQSSRSNESPKQPDPRREGSRSPESDLDPRTVRTAEGKTNTGSLPDMLKLPPALERTLSAPLAAQQLAALIDPKGASRQNSVPVAAKISRDPRSISRSNSGDDSGKEGGKPSLNYRNDPRFRKKPKSTPSAAGSQPTQDSSTTDSSTKDNTDRDSEPETKLDTLSSRRGNLDHSSPLVGGRDSGEPGTKPGENSYTSYNRPKGMNRNISRTGEGKNSPPVSGAPSLPTEGGVGFVPPPLLVREVSVSPTLLPAGLDEPPPPLKDVFKTLDPTASPFC